MAEILHQLRLVVYPIIYRVSAPSQVVVSDFSHQQYEPTILECHVRVLNVENHPSSRHLVRCSFGFLADGQGWKVEIRGLIGSFEIRDQLTS